jgi:hypothetical protein
LQVAGNAKNYFTVAAANTAAQTNLALSLIATGKTAAFEECHFGDVGYHRTDHRNQSGLHLIHLKDGSSGYEASMMMEIRSG